MDVADRRPPPKGDVPLPGDWLPAGLNQGWTYRDRVTPQDAGCSALAFYVDRYGHSDPDTWRRRLDAGEIERRGERLKPQQTLAAGERLSWRRPPWPEEAVPLPGPPLFDDGDLLVLDKPSGLPVLPAGGWLEHTLLRILERRHQQDPAGIPRPVHRLGRATSGLLVCARQPGTRAWLSRRLRESTAAGHELMVEAAAAPTGTGWPDAATGDGPSAEAAGSRPDNTAAASAAAEAKAGGRPGESARSRAGDGGPPGAARELRPPCRKLYRALLSPGMLALAPGEVLIIDTPIGRLPHPRLGWIWCAATDGQAEVLAARSRLKLLARSPAADLVEVAIASGRPHQIRIHCAAVGAPLLGDPLYRPGGQATDQALPGDGGYHLQAWRLELTLPTGERLRLQVQRPLGLPESPVGLRSACTTGSQGRPTDGIDHWAGPGFTPGRAPGPPPRG